MTVSESLLGVIERFCAREGMPETRFGLAAAEDGHLVRRLREDESMTIRRMQRVLEFIRDNSPDDAATALGPFASILDVQAGAAVRSAPSSARAC